MEMIHIRRIHLFFLLVIMGVLVASAKAQDYSVDTKPTRGFMPNFDQLGGPIDNIEVKSGKLHLEIPMASMPPGPGGMGFDINLLYESTLYNTDPMKKTFFAPPHNPPYNNLVDVPGKLMYLDNLTGGWTYNFLNYHLDGEWKSEIPPPEILNPDGVTYRACTYEESLVFRTRITLPDGSMHILHLRGTEYSGYSGDGFIGIKANGEPASACAAIHEEWQDWTGVMTYYSVDGSYLKLETTVECRVGNYITLMEEKLLKMSPEPRCTTRMEITFTCLISSMMFMVTATSWRTPATDRSLLCRNMRK